MYYILNEILLNNPFKKGNKLKATTKEMKRSGASEGKDTHKSLILHLLLLYTLLLCGCSTGKPDYAFKDSNDAISRYDAYLKKLRSVPQCSTGELVDFINNWHELSDTVYNFIKKDPSFLAHTGLKTDFFLLTDSIKDAFLRLADTKPKTMKDVATIKLNTSPYGNLRELDSIRREGETFFASLDKQPPYKVGTSADLLRQYENYLENVKSQGITDQRQLCKFIEIEDRHFRTFLSHISDYSNVKLGGITSNTEIICSKIARSAAQGKLRDDYTMVFLSMRTNRRLLQNATVCQDLLKQKKVKGGLQANAFLWMVVQPYLAMDSFAVTMLTEKQKTEYLSIADNYGDLIESLAAMGLVDKKVAGQLPSQLIRLYISTL